MSGDAYILGSGATVNYIDKDFFTGKDVIAVNLAAHRMGIYETARVITFTHYHYDALDMADAYPDSLVYAPQGHQGFAGQPQDEVLRPNIIYFEHYPTHVDFHPVVNGWPENGLLMGSSSLHGAMHLACKRGAANIILVGADCGILDEETNVRGHRLTDVPTADPDALLARWDAHLRQVKDVLVQAYGVRIYSLNPFVNPNLEGHSWRGSAGVLNAR